MTRSRIPVSRPIPRRPVLLGLTAAIAVPAVAGSVAGCADEAPDPLIALVEQARSDAALIDAAAQAWTNPPASPPVPQTGPITTALLKEVAQARREHGERLAKELGDDAPPAGPPAAPGTQDAGAALTAVVKALDASQGAAKNLVPTLSRHRAGLVGSVAACCAAYRSALV